MTNWLLSTNGSNDSQPILLSYFPNRILILGLKYKVLFNIERGTFFQMNNSILLRQVLVWLADLLENKFFSTTTKKFLL